MAGRIPEPTDKARRNSPYSNKRSVSEKEDDDEEISSYSVLDAYARDANWLSVWYAFTRLVESNVLSRRCVQPNLPVRTGLQRTRDDPTGFTNLAATRVGTGQLIPVHTPLPW